MSRYAGKKGKFNKYISKHQINKKDFMIFKNTRRIPKYGLYAIILVFIFLIAASIIVNSEKVFPKGTTINGISVSGMTCNEAEKILTEKWNKREIYIVNRKSVVGKLSKFNFEYEISDKIHDTLNPGFFRKNLRKIIPSMRKYNILMTIKRTNDDFNNQFEELSIVKNHKFTSKTKNAYVDLDDREFKIVREVYGDNLDKDTLKKAILKAISEGDNSFNYIEGKYNKLPSIKYDSKIIKERKAYAEKYLSAKIEMSGSGKTINIKPSSLDKMIKVDNRGNVKVVKSNVKKYLKKISWKFSTVGIKRKLNMPGGKISIAGGNYGNQLDIKKTVPILTKAIESRKDNKFNVVMTNSGFSRNDSVGNSYVEVSIKKQHVWCVNKGKIVLSTNVVTGNIKEGNGTPKGVFSMMYKISPSTLEGQNSDGSKYKTKVKYWMPFYADCGFHDAPWRSSFGGNIYKTGGSHGCVNMPPAQAKLLYKYVESGMPVVVHE